MPRLPAQSQVRQPPRLQCGRRRRRATRAWHVHQAAGKLVVRSTTAPYIPSQYHTHPVHARPRCASCTWSSSRRVTLRWWKAKAARRSSSPLPRYASFCAATSSALPNHATPLTIGVLSLARHRRHRCWRAAGGHAASLYRAYCTLRPYHIYISLRATSPYVLHSSTPLTMHTPLPGGHAHQRRLFR